MYKLFNNLGLFIGKNKPFFTFVLSNSLGISSSISNSIFSRFNTSIFLKSIFEGRFDPEYLQKRTPRIFTPEDKITLRATMRRVLERTEEIGCLLQWI